MSRLPRSGLLLCLLALAGLMPIAAAGQALPEPPLDPLAASMAGEFALQSGQLQDAARFYLAAAQAAEDPVLAERAARIALLADQDALAGQALTLWRRLQPQPSQTQQMVAA